MLNFQPRPERLKIRRKALAGGRLIYHGGSATVECVVRDISEGGARLRIEGTAPIPERFELVVPSRNLRMRARTVWVRDNERGVEFLEEAVPPQPAAPAPTSDEEALKRHILHLKRQIQSMELRIRELTEGI